MKGLARLSDRDDRSRQAGQVLPLVAIFMVVLFGFAALAIDVSRAYADLRLYRSAADAASLAGAQDLQVVGTRSVTGVQQVQARAHALESLVQRLGGNATACDPAVPATLSPCALVGTPYVVTIKTPSPSCSACDPMRSVQVTVRHPNYGLTFARVLGSSEWDVGTTSVAGLVFGKSYTVITLRPPKKLGSTFDVKDITITGGSVLNVDKGDVGSNSNMNYSGSGSILTLDSGFSMYYFDPLSGPLWGVSPPGQKIPTLITDPNYRYPDMTGSPAAYTDARTSTAGPAPKPVQRASADAACAAEVLKVDPVRYAFMATQALNTIYCYNPGIYDDPSGSKAQIVVGTGDVALLKPGAYYLKDGLDIGGRLIGGYQPGAPGVALMLDECKTSACTFSGNNALTIALNAGTRFPPSFAGGTPATAARDWTNQLVETSGPDGPTPPLPITISVKKDPTCFVPTSAPFIEPAACDASKNVTLNVAGGGSLALEGVQYAPTDNVAINGGSSGYGRVGQIISWTLVYTGGTHINQIGPDSTANGILRIDAACSAPAEPCSP